MAIKKIETNAVDYRWRRRHIVGISHAALQIHTTALLINKLNV